MNVLASLCGLVFGIVMAIIGSSRFWQGCEITTGGEIDVLFGWKMPTWKSHGAGGSDSLAR